MDIMNFNLANSVGSVLPSFNSFQGGGASLLPFGNPFESAGFNSNVPFGQSGGVSAVNSFGFGCDFGALLSNLFVSLEQLNFSTPQITGTNTFNLFNNTNNNLQNNIFGGLLNGSGSVVLQSPMFSFATPNIDSWSFDGLNVPTTPSNGISSGATSSVSGGSYQKYSIGKFDLNYWKSRGYNHEKGKELALDAAKVTKGTPGQCVGYTRKTINRVYGTNFTNAGSAYNFGNKILSSPELRGKFRKATREEIAQGGIPDGAVVLWNPNTPGFTRGKAAIHGHGGICYQNKVYSNYVESKHLDTYAEIWIPV